MERTHVRIWLTPQEVANLVGFSGAFVRRDISMKVIPAQFVQPRRKGGCGRWRIHRDDAVAYAIKLGVWREAVSS
jgi:hypothetical protein